MFPVHIPLDILHVFCGGFFFYKEKTNMFMFVKVTPLHLHTNINRLIHLILANIIIRHVASFFNVENGDYPKSFTSKQTKT